MAKTKKKFKTVSLTDVGVNAALTATAGGAADSASQTGEIDVTIGDGWSRYAALFQEWKFNRAEVRFIPYKPVADGGTTFGLFDKDTSVVNANTYLKSPYGFRQFNAKNWKSIPMIVYTPADPENEWRDTSDVTTYSKYGIWASSGLYTASTSLGWFQITFFLQFRGTI